MSVPTEFGPPGSSQGGKVKSPAPPAGRRHRTSPRSVDPRGHMGYHWPAKISSTHVSAREEHASRGLVAREAARGLENSVTLPTKSV